MPTDDPPASALGPWSVTASRHVLRDRWISVRADDCLTAEGARVAPFYVLEYPDWVQVVAIDTADRLILIRQYRHGSGEVILELPCGGMEATDADPVAAARRELVEETGYGGGEWRLVGSGRPNAANQANRSHVILATGVMLVGVPVEEPSERVEVVRLIVAEAVELALTGGLPQVLHVAALAMALTPIGRWSPPTTDVDQSRVTPPPATC